MANNRKGKLLTTYGSLFSGAGGFDLGCDAAGWECKFQVERDTHPKSVLFHHWPDVPKWSDVRDVDGAKLPPVDVITFGFPCQDLTTGGKRAGLDGHRSGLFFEAIRIIDEMREDTHGQFPTIVCIENVPGLLNADRGAAMGRCLDELAHIGAVGIEWRVYDAQFFGVPQRRRRIFIAASFDPRTLRHGPLFPDPERMSKHLGQDRNKRETAAPTVAGRIADTTDTNILAFVKGQRARDIDDFETWEMDRPSPTLNAFDNRHETRATVLVVHDNTPPIVRRLTPRECERLQGWPDDHTRWDNNGNEIRDGARFEMIGNGVAAPVGEYVARSIDRVLQ